MQPKVTTITMNLVNANGAEIVTRRTFLAQTDRIWALHNKIDTVGEDAHD